MPFRERKHILVTDDEPNLRRVLAAQLTRDGYEVHLAENGRKALETIETTAIDVLIADLRMPEIDGLSLLKRVTASHPEIPVILITAHGTVDTAVEALKLGAFDYVTKPFDQAEFRAVVQKAVKTRELAKSDVSDETGELGRFRLIGESRAMHVIYEAIERVADTQSTVLITGESGTGKELIARALHEQSGRKNKPFVRVNSAAIPSELIESELFGYERGAFTGAITSKPGRFELADGGTLFLDEIGEIPIHMQAKLLRAIQESEFERVGGVKTLRVDVRLVAATNQDLKLATDAGRFREDLYYRINVVQLRIPPLRERKDDIPLLVRHFIHKFNKRLGKKITGLDDNAAALFSEHAWRGNIRELENVIEHCVLFCDGAIIEPRHLPSAFAEGIPAPQAAPEPIPTTGLIQLPNEPIAWHLKEVVRQATTQVERDWIQKALSKTDGNVTQAAKLLGISRKSLQLKMKEYDLR